MIRNDITYTTPHPDFGRIEGHKIYYRNSKLTHSGAEKMLKTGAPQSPGGEPSEGCLTARVVRVESMAIQDT